MTDAGGLVEAVGLAMREQAVGWEDYIRQGAGWPLLARAALSAISAAGWAVVPKEATEEMRNEGKMILFRPDKSWSVSDVYRGMLAAAPKVPS